MRTVLGILPALLLCASVQPSAAGEPPPDMARIPGGVFRPFTRSMEPSPVEAFLLEKRPVTNAEFLAFVKANPEWRKGRAPELFVDAEYLRHWEGPLTPGEKAPLESPVTSVSWFAARAYAEWRERRLPTLAEWEHAAARMPAETARSEILAWYAEPLRIPPPAAGSAPPTADGVRDLHGLIWEWTEDFNAVSLTSRAADGDAPSPYFCGGGAAGAADPSDYAAFLRYAFRGSLSPTHTVAGLGFRCARDLEPSK